MDVGTENQLLERGKKRTNRMSQYSNFSSVVNGLAKASMEWRNTGAVTGFDGTEL